MAASPIPVALLYQAQSHHDHLQRALQELGAAVVYSTGASRFDFDAFRRSGAKVVVVNLDTEDESDVPYLDELLDDDSLKVVFNDADASSRLAGWDQARWARHLAAKILGVNEINPPLPSGAAIIPAVAASSDAISPDFDLISEELAHALAADTSESMKRIQANLVTKDEPILPSLIDNEKKFSEQPSVRATNEAPAQSRPTLANITPLANDTDYLLGEALARSDSPATRTTPAKSDESATMLAAFGLDDIDDDAARELESTLRDFGLLNYSNSPADQEQAEDTDLADLDAAMEDNSVLFETPVLDAAAEEAFDAEPSFMREETPALGLEDLLLNINMDNKNIKLQEQPASKPEEKREQPKKPPSKAKDYSEIEKLDLSHLSLQPLEEIEAEPPSTSPRFSTPNKQRPAPPAAARTEPKAEDDDLPLIEFDLTPEMLASLKKSAPAPSRATTPSSQFGLQAKIWILGASIGGPEAIRDFFEALPDGVAATFILVQHMGEDFILPMQQQVQKVTARPVRLVQTGDRIALGDIIMAPLNERLLIDSSGGVTLQPYQNQSPYSPSIDRVTEDAIAQFGDRVNLVIFSGMAQDGIEASQAVHRNGGHVWVQDPATCVIASMAETVRDSGVAGLAGSPANLAKQLASLESH